MNIVGLGWTHSLVTHSSVLSPSPLLEGSGAREDTLHAGIKIDGDETKDKTAAVVNLIIVNNFVRSRLCALELLDSIDRPINWYQAVTRLIENGTKSERQPEEDYSHLRENRY